MYNKTNIKKTINQIKFINSFIKYKLFFIKMNITDLKNYEKVLKENNDLSFHVWNKNNEEYVKTNICLQPKLIKPGFYQPELIWLKYNRDPDWIYISISNEYCEMIIRRGKL